ATAAPIDAVVIAQWLHTLRRRRQNRLHGSAREALPRVDLDSHLIAGCGARSEDHHAVGARDAVAASRDGIDRDIERRHLSPSSRATRSHASPVSVVELPFGAALPFALARFGARRSPSAINAAI